MEKDAAIVDLLSWLRGRLGDGLKLADHWEADPSAIGLCAADDASRLAYIANLDDGNFCVVLETAPPPASEIPYQEVGHFDRIDRETLLAVVTQHLTIEGSASPEISPRS